MKINDREKELREQTSLINQVILFFILFIYLSQSYIFMHPYS